VSDARLIDGSVPEASEGLLARLDGLGIQATTVRHPFVFTVDDAKALRGALEGAHVKNLYVRDTKGAMWLLVALEDRRIDLRALDGALGHKRFSSPAPVAWRPTWASFGQRQDDRDIGGGHASVPRRGRPRADVGRPSGHRAPPGLRRASSCKGLLRPT
jgi:hypothetical protein